MENDLLFARQPIFDAKNKLYGYELLYRNIHPNAAVFDDGNKATSELLINYCSGILNDESCPYVKIFINFTRRLILSDYFLPLESSRIVVEILENTKIDSILIDKVKSLKKFGYEFALDDYNFSEEYDQIIPFINYIKIDITRINREKLTHNLEKLNQRVLNHLPHRPRLVAEKVEQQTQYNFCRDLNFELFQGYFLERPHLVYGKKISNSAETALQVVAKLQEDDLDVDNLCHAVSRDTKLSYKLLKIVNSPLYRIPKKVSSLKEAIIILGIDQVKKWAMALVLSGDNTKSSELFRILFTRARACEIYAIAQNYEEPEKFFTVGLFSSIDAIMFADKKWLIESLELSQDMNDAIIEGKGLKGEVLKFIIALEHNDFSVTNQLSDNDRIELFSAHETAIDWANEFYAAL